MALADRTTDGIYDTSCNHIQSLQIATNPGPCVSRYFLCNRNTTIIGGYDDPTTGLAYICTADTTAEACGDDTVSLCVSAVFHMLISFCLCPRCYSG
jgi:hypothetical protein